ncbi:MAG: 1-deoxy-D-xylulose-5-phosphate reductoisomerase [Propionibacteriaceae bacterium]|jgi:1-deoxy-D-xylulose-5-phosphate reductoisomerase|nr:1-deoxy-D-xylulose-5-phosphate reductoisomerase [Propionibacteriaceae bacterium]
MRDVVILGSTGSIGRQAVEVVRANPGLFRVVGLAAGGSRLAELAEQARALRPGIVAVSDEQGAERLRGELPGVAVWGGPDAASRLAGVESDVVLNGITGAVGLLPTLAALAAGTTLALANKESLVIGGALVTSAAAPGQLVPVDSEHSAFAQALRAGRASEVRRLILTASGGPFRGRSAEQLKDVTVAQALAHPTWDMGRVVTINSATLVNKGLELIEAGLLFGVGLDNIQVVVHPQSVVHSMVEFHDGSTIAQCSPPSMMLPIALGLGWPDRVADAARPCDWSRAASWTFEPLDSQTFPAVELARKVGKLGGGFPAVYNAANEVAVDAFCAGGLGFAQIVSTLAGTVDAYASWSSSQPGVGAANPRTADDVLAADAWARRAARELIADRS